MRLFYTFLLLLCFCFVQAQSHKKKYKKPAGPLQNKWAWSANASVFAFSNIKGHTSAGFDAEWYFNEHWSLRGGLSVGPDYIKITTEPFTLRYITEKRTGHSYYRHSDWSWKAAQALFIFLINSDAICYNIPIQKGLYASVIASPLQTIFTTADGKLHAYSLIGGGLKYISPKGLTLNATLEYDQSCLFKTSDRGVKFNFSVGYLFR